jgi:alkylation response protein AidB-like acyl-CoA dehydrogenase
VTQQETLRSVRELAERWRAERTERFRRDRLDPADFEALGATGYYQMPIPSDQGGSWESVRASTRGVADAVRALAAADPSPALVAAMHPAVLGFWLGADPPDQPAWAEQRRAVLATAAAGHRWGTVTSEPGSGGDVSRTRTQATPIGTDAGPGDVAGDVPGSRYRLTGDKHFGSGTGTCAFMLTTAIPAEEAGPAAFFVDTRPVMAAGSDGLAGMDGFTVVAPWDGVGMSATQSHAVRLDDCPAVRFAWDGPLDDLVAGAAALNMCLFAGVVLGVVDEAMATATERLGPRAEGLRPYEQVEWSHACTEHWLMAQAYEGMLRAIEQDDQFDARRAALHGKAAAAELAEQVLRRLARVVGGGSFSRSSPFASWFEDVRALGFLRPPWGLTYDGIFALSWTASGRREG